MMRCVAVRHGAARQRNAKHPVWRNLYTTLFLRKKSDFDYTAAPTTPTARWNRSVTGLVHSTNRLNRV